MFRGISHLWERRHFDACRLARQGRRSPGRIPGVDLQAGSAFTDTP
jgi:hypothetical protein